MTTRKKTKQKTPGTKKETQELPTYTIQNCSFIAESAKIPPQLVAAMSDLAAAARANAEAISAIAAISSNIEAGSIGTGISINGPQGECPP